MVYLTFNNNIFKFDDDILKISTYISELYKYRTYENEPIPLLNCSDVIFEKFVEWFNLLKNEGITKFSKNHVVIFKPEIFTSQKFPQKFFQNFLVEIFNFGFYNQIRLLCETLAYVIGTYNFNLQNIHESLRLMILKNSSDVVIPYSRFINEACVFPQFDENVEKCIIPYNTDLKDGIFRKCKKLSSVVLPNNTIIHDETFFNCQNLHIIHNNTIFRVPISTTEYLIPEGITKIGFHAFRNCEIKHIVIPKSVKEICYSAFKDCVNLETVEIQNPDIIIHKSVFCGCPKLNLYFNNTIFRVPISTTEYVIPENTKIIREYAFSHCMNLTKIIIPESVEYIGNYAFNGCVNLENVNKTDAKLGIKVFENTKVFKNCF